MSTTYSTPDDSAQYKVSDCKSKMIVYENSTGSKSANIHLADILTHHHNGTLVVPQANRGIQVRGYVRMWFKDKYLRENIRTLHFDDGALTTFSQFIMANQAGEQS